MADTKQEATTEVPAKKPSFFGKIFKGLMNIVTLGLFSKLLNKKNNKAEKAEETDKEENKNAEIYHPTEEIEAAKAEAKAKEEADKETEKNTKSSSEKATEKDEKKEEKKEEEAQPGA